MQTKVSTCTLETWKSCTMNTYASLSVQLQLHLSCCKWTEYLGFTWQKWNWFLGSHLLLSYYYMIFGHYSKSICTLDVPLQEFPTWSTVTRPTLPCSSTSPPRCVTGASTCARSAPVSVLLARNKLQQWREECFISNEVKRREAIKAEQIKWMEISRGGGRTSVIFHSS